MGVYRRSLTRCFKASGAVAPFAPIKLVEKNLKLLRPTYASFFNYSLFELTLENRMSNYLVTPDEAHHYGTLIFDLISQGVLKINIFKEYPFTAEGVQQAQKDLTGGKSTGKLVVKVDG